MEEKKLDINTIIGFVLIFGILIFMFWQNQPTPEELEAKKAQQEQVEAAEMQKANMVKEEIAQPKSIDLHDSTAVASYKSAIRCFWLYRSFRRNYGIGK